MGDQQYGDSLGNRPRYHAWMDDAACLDLPIAMFFGKSAEGKAVCRDCPVRIKCLAFALNAEKGGGKRVGILGGLGSQERENLQQALNKINKEKKDGSQE